MDKVISLKSWLLSWGLAAACVAFNCYGNLLLKRQVEKVGTWEFAGVGSVVGYFGSVLGEVGTWVGLGSIGVALMSWLVAVGHLELSRVYPVTVGCNLIVVSLMSIFYFHEPVTVAKLVGMGLIFCGVVVLF